MESDGNYKVRPTVALLHSNRFNDNALVRPSTVSSRGGDLRGDSEDGPLQNFRWWGRRCLRPPKFQKYFIKYKFLQCFSLFIFASVVRVKLQCYVGNCLLFYFYLFRHRKHLNGTSLKHIGLNTHFVPPVSQN